MARVQFPVTEIFCSTHTETAVFVPNIRIVFVLKALKLHKLVPPGHFLELHEGGDLVGPGEDPGGAGGGLPPPPLRERLPHLLRPQVLGRRPKVVRRPKEGLVHPPLVSVPVVPGDPPVHTGWI